MITMRTDGTAPGPINLFLVPRAERPALCLQQGRHLRPMLREIPAPDGAPVVECTFCGQGVHNSEIPEMWPGWRHIPPTAPLSAQLAALPRLREGDSTLSYCARLPRRRYSHESKGKLLLFPRTGHIMVPYTYHRGGAWTCVVVRGDDTYRPDGHSLDVCEEEIETALEVPIDAPEVR